MENQKNWAPSIALLIFILGSGYPFLGKTLESTPQWHVSDIFLYPFLPLLLINGCILGFLIKKRLSGAVVIFVLSLTQSALLGRSINAWLLGFSFVGNLIFIMILAESTWSIRSVVGLVLIPPLITCFSQLIWHPMSYYDRLKKRGAEMKVRENAPAYLSKPEDKSDDH
ncbi:MAG: hypothetical protein JNM39_00110 [Bdellovibrionaceae bacterium]|nr:hypothetical protein [Pseudobdellovibrionaceae bacterium]